MRAAAVLTCAQAPRRRQQRAAPRRVRPRCGARLVAEGGVEQLARAGLPRALAAPAAPRCGVARPGRPGRSGRRPRCAPCCRRRCRRRPRWRLAPRRRARCRRRLVRGVRQLALLQLHRRAAAVQRRVAVASGGGGSGAVVSCRLRVCARAGASSRQPRAPRARPRAPESSDASSSRNSALKSDMQGQRGGALCATLAAPCVAWRLVATARCAAHAPPRESGLRREHAWAQRRGSKAIEE
jgi:hypothetical protein